MKHSLCLFLILMLSFTVHAQKTGFTGVVTDAESGKPVPGVMVRLLGQDIAVFTGPAGDFLITNATRGKDMITFSSAGYGDVQKEVIGVTDRITDLGKIKMSATDSPYATDDDGLITFDESQIDDDAGTGQTIGNLSGAYDDVYLSTASYAFGTTRFRIRGYDSDYTKIYLNGINFNDPARGQFNYSMMGGMNNAFRNKDIISGIDISNFSFGDLGGATNITTRASEYAPGFRGSAAYTNRNYQWRVMMSYSTGLLPSGWAFTFNAITRLGENGPVDGVFYNSIGYFLSAEKVFNQKHSLSVTTFGAPTQRGQSAATYEEAYQLAGDNLYNPNWGYQQGKKRNARVVESFDPTAMISWLYKPQTGTTVSTGIAFRHSRYGSSALNWYNAQDPRPDYYRRLPSYYSDNPILDALYTNLWENDEQFRQINWDHMYEVNYLNNWENQNKGSDKGSTYIVENRFSNQTNLFFNSHINHRLNDVMTLQGGIGLKYTDAHYYKTVKDLMGGEFWLDVDQFSERDYPNNSDILQNNLNNPNFKAKKGDKFGYDYNIHSIVGNAWLQNNINLPQWDIYYGLQMAYSQFQRFGNMRNGRAPENSFGKGKIHIFNDAGVKAGVTYKLDGRNFFIFNAMYETRAPFFGYAYISPRIKDDIIPDLQSERVLSGDLTYRFSYPRFKGRITGFYTNFYDQTDATSFYHDQYQTFVNYILTGVRKSYKGVEIGLAYKITPSVTVTGVATFARYQYKNRPTGITNYENGSRADTTQTVYLKNFYVGGTPQQAFNIGVDWSAPKMWFFDINLSWFDKAYVDLSPLRRTQEAVNFPLEGNTQTEIMHYFDEKAAEITHQQKLKGGFILNASVGKLIYLTRSSSLNINVSLSNILNKKNLQTGGYEQGRFDFTNFNVNKYPNKYYYAQGFNVFVNVGFKF
ncbi:MAG: TonB-dependent receptor [Bacteroidales bacterium]